MISFLIRGVVKLEKVVTEKKKSVKEKNEMTRVKAGLSLTQLSPSFFLLTLPLVEIVIASKRMYLFI